jgi:hypothetical protein
MNTKYIDKVKDLTKRELFAAMAMQGLLSNPETWHLYKPNHAIENADKLLKELEK